MSARNPDADTDAVWRVEIAVPSERCVAGFEAALAGLGGALTLSGIEGGGGLRLIAHVSEAPDEAAIEARIAVAAAAAAIAPPALLIEKLAQTDWVADYQRRTGPQQVARFFIHPSHFAGEVPAASIAIRLDAGLAFGTGEHESTRGCLMALDRLARHGRRRVGRGLDMGSGSGILAIAMARLWNAPVLACDNDPDAVAVAADNARTNGVSDLVETVRGDGYGAPEVARDAPFDLIAANILAQPLIAMAGGLAGHLERDGAAVLSGLLTSQADEVGAAHRAHGLEIADHIRIGQWSTLILKHADQHPRGF